MIDLDKALKRLDEALKKETKESLQKWLEKDDAQMKKEMEGVDNKIFICECIEPLVEPKLFPKECFKCKKTVNY